MPELTAVEPAKTAGFVNPSSARAKRKAKIEAEEAALAALLKGEEPESDVETEEETTAKEEVIPEPEKKEVREVEEKNPEPSSAEERTFKKRYGDLRRHSDKQIQELKDEIAKLKNNPGAIVAPKSDEDIDAWLKQYPEVGSIVTSIAKREAQSLNSRFDSLEQERAEFRRQKAEDKIRKAHSDFDKLQASDEFHDWVESKSKWVQDALYENQDDPEAVINVIDMYKAATGQTVDTKKAAQKEAAKDVTTKASAKVETDEKPRFSESQIKRNSDEWFSRNAQAIDEAIREGRFDYDMSRAR